MGLSFKARMEIIDKSIEYIDAFKYFLPDLKKSGSNYKCLSPFKKEKTPSFVVSPNKKIWHCFSTGVGGKSVVDFIVKYEGLKFKDAIEYVEATFGLKKNVYDSDVMKKVVGSLNKKKSNQSNDGLKIVYERKLNRFIDNFKKTCNDRCFVLAPRIEYIWECFDERKMASYREFRMFLRWVYRFLRHTRDEVVVPLGCFIKKYKKKYTQPLGNKQVRTNEVKRRTKRFTKKYRSVN